MTLLRPSRVGDRIAGRFELLAEIGVGGTGRVFRARAGDRASECAVKLVPIDLDLDGPDEVERRFQREARIAVLFTHPNALEVHEIGRDGHNLYIVMDLLRGTTLRALLQRGVPMPWRIGLDILTQLADVLVEAHRIDLVHRDLKPENVFVEPNGDGRIVRVVDFGLAFIVGGADTGRLTKESVVLGTPTYLSPEQIGGGSVGTKSDVYAWGCLAYEVLTGWPPFRGSDVTVLTQHIHVEPPSLRERAPAADVPEALDELVLSALNKSIDGRPTSREVLDALERLA